MLFSLLVTTVAIIIGVWFAFMATDYFVAAFPPTTPQPNPPRFALASIIKFVIAFVALVVFCEAAFGDHRWLIHVSGF